MSAILHKYIDEFSHGRNVETADAEALLDALISESDQSLIAALLDAWHRKGIEEDEIFSIAQIMRQRMTRVNSPHKKIVDIVGTGGSKLKTFNVSTAAAFVIAGSEMPVAKHGNKAATSNSGSADVLSELGIDPAVDPATAERCLNDLGICFMFAPNYHRLSPTLGSVRRGLGFPTIFNCVGPLCNPASVSYQLIGVWDKQLVPKMAGALARLGTKRSWVIHGEGGLDEITLFGVTTVAEVAGAKVKTFEIMPKYFGFGEAELNDLRAAGSAHSGQMILNVLKGEPHSKAAEDIVLINAAAAIQLTGVEPLDAARKARESLANGRAHKKYEGLAQAIPV